jgi:hypothetical protein
VLNQHWEETMAAKYQHRIGVRSELILTMILDSPNPSLEELSEAVGQVLRAASDVEGGIANLDSLADAVVFPDWNSVDLGIESTGLLDPSAVRSIEWVKINSIH